MDKILKELQRTTGTDFGSYRSELSQERILERMAKLEIHDPSEYLNRLRRDLSERDILIDAFAIKVTSFFRNPIVFEILADQVLPRIIRRCKCVGTRQIRIWSAGCATGEEAYSMAILIHNALMNEPTCWHSYIFATDISQNALCSAQKGIYPRKSFENTKLGILDKYFIARGDQYEVCPFIREMVRFSRDDLTSRNRFAPADSVFGTFDVVLCRNVLIYFSAALQKRVCEKLHKALDKGGFLVIGDSEYLDSDTERRLSSVEPGNRIFQKPE